MSFELAQKVRAALRDGSVMADLETLLLAQGESPDEIAAAWLYAWAYEALLPWPDDLAAQITRRCAPRRRFIPRGRDDRTGAQGELRTTPTNRERSSSGSPSNLRTGRRSRTAWSSAPNRDSTDRSR
jgi:hypothetical protein